MSPSCDMKPMNKGITYYALNNFSFPCRTWNSNPQRELQDIECVSMETTKLHIYAICMPQVINHK